MMVLKVKGVSKTFYLSIFVKYYVIPLQNSTDKKRYTGLDVSNMAE